MDRWQAMRVFVRVAESGGFAAAARQLNISPPAVTRAVAALENRIGTRLLTRTTRSLMLTEAGGRYLEDCRRILADMEEAEALAAGAYATPSGTLTITAPVQFGRLYVLPAITDFLARYPAVGVSASCVLPTPPRPAMAWVSAVASPWPSWRSSASSSAARPVKLTFRACGTCQ